MASLMAEVGFALSFMLTRTMYFLVERPLPLPGTVFVHFAPILLNQLNQTDLCHFLGAHLRNRPSQNKGLSPRNFGVSVPVSPGSIATDALQLLQRLPVYLLLVFRARVVHPSITQQTFPHRIVPTHCLDCFSSQMLLNP